MTEPYISVIICTRNRAERLPGIFEDLKEQRLTHAFTWEVLLVDNGSTDGTRDIVEKYGKEGNLDIRYMFEGTQGKCFALNSGIKAARGELLAFTDDDVRLDNYWLWAIHEAGSTQPHNCFGGKVLPLSNPALPAWLARDDKRFEIYGGALVKHDWGRQAPGVRREHVCAHRRQHVCSQEHV